MTLKIAEIYKFINLKNQFENIEASEAKSNKRYSWNPYLDTHITILCDNTENFISFYFLILKILMLGKVKKRY